MLGHLYRLPAGIEVFYFLFCLYSLLRRRESFGFRLIQVGVAVASGCTCTSIVSGAPDGILPSCRCVYACVCVCMCVCVCVCVYVCVCVCVSLVNQPLLPRVDRLQYDGKRSTRGRRGWFTRQCVCVVSVSLLYTCKCIFVRWILPFYINRRVGHTICACSMLM